FLDLDAGQRPRSLDLDDEPDVSHAAAGPDRHRQRPGRWLRLVQRRFRRRRIQRRRFRRRRGKLVVRYTTWRSTWIVGFVPITFRSVPSRPNPFQSVDLRTESPKSRPLSFPTQPSAVRSVHELAIEEWAGEISRSNARGIG